MKQFSEVLKELRIEKQVTVKQLADYLELTKRSVSYYETGERFPDFHGLITLADYFNVSIDYLVGRSDIRERR